MIKSACFSQKNNNRDILLHATSIVFLMLFAFPLYTFKFANILFILFSFLTLILLLKKPIPIGKLILNNLVFVLPFIPYLFEFIFSGFQSIPRFEFEKKLFFFTAFFFIPVFIKITHFRYYKTALLIFSITLSILCIYAFTIITVRGLPFFSETYQNGSFLLRHHFEKLTGIHSTYYACFALFATFILFKQDTFKNRTLIIIFRCVSVLLLLSALYLAVRIAFITVFFFFLLAIFTQKMAFFRKLILGAVLIVFMTAVSFIVPSLNSRLKELVWYEKETINHNNTISQRTVIMQCSYDVFKTHWLTGTGSGNFQQHLNNCYNSKSWNQGASLNFNPHNQYLSIAVNYGIFALLLFLACLYFIFRKLIKIPEASCFILIIILFFLTESLLERSMGIYFFGLFSILMYNLRSELS